MLIDFENVQPQKMNVLKVGRFKIKVFMGATQNRVPLEMARALQVFGPDAEYVQIDGSGSNALDFHIAYYIGRLAAQHPDAYFHVISKDTGFDPLVRHLRNQKIRCHRSAALSDIPPVKIVDAKTVTEMAAAVLQNFAKRSAGKPRTEKTLRSTIKSMFANRLSDTELDAVLDELKTRTFLEMVDGKIRYHQAEDQVREIPLRPATDRVPLKTV